MPKSVPAKGVRQPPSRSPVRAKPKTAVGYAVSNTIRFLSASPSVFASSALSGSKHHETFAFCGPVATLPVLDCPCRGAENRTTRVLTTVHKNSLDDVPILFYFLSCGGMDLSVQEDEVAVMAAAPDFDTDDLYENLHALQRLVRFLSPLGYLPKAHGESGLMSGAAEMVVATIRGSSVEAALLEKHVRVPLGHDAADARLKGGLRRGALHEVFAQGGHEAAATGFAAALAGRVCGRRHLLWIRQDFSALEFGELAGTGLLELGIDPGQVLLLRVDDAMAALRAGIDALSCAGLGAVVIEIPGDPKVLDLTASRRLTLASAQGNVTAILLRFSAEPDASTAETRWLIRGAKSSEEEDWGKPVFEAHLVRNRSGQTGCWMMEWNCDEGLFQAAHSGAVVPAASDRQAAAARAFVA